MIRRAAARGKVIWGRYPLVRFAVRLIPAAIGGYMAYTGATGRHLLWKTAPQTIRRLGTADTGRWSLVVVGLLLVVLAVGPSAWATVQRVIRRGGKEAAAEAEPKPEEKPPPPARSAAPYPPGSVLGEVHNEQLVAATRRVRAEHELEQVGAIPQRERDKRRLIKDLYALLPSLESAITIRSITQAALLPSDVRKVAREARGYVVGDLGGHPALLDRENEDAMLDGQRRDDLLAIVNSYLAILEGRAAPEPGPPQPEHRVTDELSAYVTRSEEIPELDLLSFKTEGQPVRFVATPGLPRALVFRKPMAFEVRESNLPVAIPCGDGRLKVKKFGNLGVTFSEEGTRGDEVQAEVYLEAPRGSREWRRHVVSDLIEDGLAVRDAALGERGDVLQARAAVDAQEWAEGVQRTLDRDVREFRGLFPHETEPGFEDSEVVAFVDERVEVLRGILGKL